MKTALILLAIFMFVVMPVVIIAMFRGALRAVPKNWPYVGCCCSFLLLAALSCPAAAQEKAKAPPLTNAQVPSLLQAIANLDGRLAVVKQNGQDIAIPVSWDFGTGSGLLRLRLARATTMLTAAQKTLDEARIAVVKEIIAKIPAADKDGKAATEIPPGTPEMVAFQKQYGDMLNAPAQVELPRIRASELCLEKSDRCPVKNDIPVSALSALGPILDDDVSPKP